eukprot:5016766-Amphidinium_carterae.1
MPYDSEEYQLRDDMVEWSLDLVLCEDSKHHRNQLSRERVLRCMCSCIGSSICEGVTQVHGRGGPDSLGIGRQLSHFDGEQGRPWKGQA